MNRKSQIIKKRIVSSFKKNLLMGFLVLTFLVLNIFLSLQTVTSGSKLSNLEKTENKLVRENRQLSSDLSEATSLTLVQKSAIELGFQKPSELVYAKDVEAVASKLH